MKNKSNKRSSSNKHSHHRRHFHPLATRRSSIPGNGQLRTLTPSRVHYGTGVAHLDESKACLRPANLSKNVKLLKKDLLKCSNQRPSLLGPQTLQPPRLHQSQQSHPSSSSVGAIDPPARHRSLSNHSSSFYATIDRIGPWPDVSISRIRSDGNELLRAVENVSKCEKSSRLLAEILRGDDGQQHAIQISSVDANVHRRVPKAERLRVELRVRCRWARRRLCPSPRRSFCRRTTTINCRSEARSPERPVTRRRAILRICKNRRTNRPNRRFCLSSCRAAIRRKAIVPLRRRRSSRNRRSRCPTLAHSSLHYLNSMNSVEKTYGEHKKTPRHANPSKVFLLDGRQKKR